MRLESVFGLKGRTALITGSSRGIGAAIAEGLAGAGAHVILHGIKPGAAAAVQHRIVASGGTAQELAGDLSEPGAGRDLIERAEAIAPVDILVINASAQINAVLSELTPDDLAFQLAVNLGSTVDMLQAALPRMAARKWGRVVSIGSVNQLRPKGIVTAYAATKAAQHNLIQSQARDYARDNVLLNTLAPGLIDTDRNAHRRDEDPEGWAEYVRTLNWMGRAGQPEEMVGAAIFLSSQACSFMTGENIFLTGGY
ncbi:MULTISPECIES: SDR family NAD(P)-dependent oxidoreductase [Rhizobium/Agrobacterium group]|uniref:SDR family NAD(P)-dependent oxidoreductase n=1 Tax=Rhizobium/Agrobacterium group TaxID=227290 RepID=UPI00107F80E2|nr:MULTISPECIES: SDR family oxidoreductase [Rhizobium/Agrobacterium group]MBB4403534.1 NAD(P)-dependent dehydrogenase (short-subunit alcohol dehydrogenase family) [Agrobacterium radiobacter]MBB5589686.1 NAD(P)-dependent dehydrogenase (short-subunit alcohol dehydrogenase family) [Agrobacterium radiobacter]TGE87233.1 short-chain dehydrogenase [Rhizobium sp. SEMIA 4032]